MTFVCQAVLARLEALENDNPGLETVEVNDDSDASLDDDDEQGHFLDYQFSISYFVVDRVSIFYVTKIWSKFMSLIFFLLCPVECGYCY